MMRGVEEVMSFDFWQQSLLLTMALDLMNRKAPRNKVAIPGTHSTKLHQLSDLEPFF